MYKKTAVLIRYLEDNSQNRPKGHRRLHYRPGKCIGIALMRRDLAVAFTLYARTGTALRILRAVYAEEL